MRSTITACFMIGACFTATAARAALDPETKKPYQLQVVLQIGSNRVFTPLFQDQLERDLANQLKAIFGDLARVEVTRSHPLLGEIKTKGLNAALESWDALSERTTHFVLLDYVEGAYRIQTRSHEGLTGQAGPPSPPIQTHQRDEIARTIGQRVETAFSPVGTVSGVGKSVTLKLKGGELGVPLDRWIGKGHVFAVSRITEEGGRRKAQRLEWALLEVLDPPAAGVCRCKYWHRYQEDDLGETPGTLGFRALRLPTAPGPVKVQLLDDTTLAPLEGVRVRVQRPGAGKPVELITNRDGLALSREIFNHLALVQVLSGDTVRARFPVELILGRTAVARVKIEPGGESLAPFETRRDAWLRRVYENARLSSDRARDLATQLHQSLDAALAAGKKSLPELEAEIRYLAAERDQLSRLAKEKKWRFDLRAGDQELAELRQQAKDLGDFVQRVESVLKDVGSEKSLGLVQLVERARLFEAEAGFEHAIRLYDQVVKTSPAEKKVKAHMDKLKEGWTLKSEKHQQAREFFYQTWPVLDVAGLGKNMDRAQEALAALKSAGDKLTPLKFLRVNAAHTANLQKQLDALKRRDNEDNRNKTKTLAAIGETLIRLHQDAAVWVGAQGLTRDSVGKRDVFRMHVHEINAVDFQNGDDGLHFGPVFAELLDFLGPPVRHHFFREIGRLFEVSAAEIETEGPRDDGHFDDPQVVVVFDQLGDLAASNHRQTTFLKPEIYVSLPYKLRFAVTRFDGRMARLAWRRIPSFRNVNNAVHAVTKFAPENQAVFFSVLVRSLQGVFFGAHDGNSHLRMEIKMLYWQYVTHIARRPSHVSGGNTMSAKPASFGHSADVRIQLNVNGFVLNVAQLGPDFITVRDGVEHPPADAEIVMSIDGEVSRWNVHLPDGISAAKPHTKIT